MAPAAALWRLALVFGMAPLGLQGVFVEAESEGGLPLGFASRTVAKLELRYHQEPGWNMAFYLPAPMASSADIAASTGAPGVLPSQLWLFAPYYLRGPLPRALSEMPVDVSEHLFHAVLLAYLDVEWAPGSHLRAVADERAMELMEDVPPEHRREAYLEALASFGSHVLSMANELERKEKARRAQGRSLCAIISRQGTLFGLWERSFADGPYPGRYHPRGEDGQGATIYSRSILEPRDKRVLVREVFQDVWTGSARADFGPRFCHESSPGSQARDSLAGKGATRFGQ